MKRNLTLILLAFSYLMPVMGMPYKEARDQALYLTDKMAYELNLNSQQYNDCYEINLDYFLSVQTPDEVYGPYLAYRNADLRHILLDWQFRIFSAVDYFPSLSPLRSEPLLLFASAGFLGLSWRTWPCTFHPRILCRPQTEMGWRNTGQRRLSASQLHPYHGLSSRSWFSSRRTSPGFSTRQP